MSIFRLSIPQNISQNTQSLSKSCQNFSQKTQIVAQQISVEFRKRQHIILYILLAINNVSSGFQHLIFFFTNTGYGFVIAHIAYILRGILWITSILTLLDWNWKEALKFFLLVDSILLFQLMTICVCVFMFIIYQNYAYYTITFVITVTIVTHLNTTNFRVLMAHVFWSKWQIIIYKLAYIVVCLFYLSLGSYLITTKAMITNDSQKNDLINQYIILYVGANVTYFSELYNKITDYDGTGQMKFTYQLLDEQSDELKSSKNQNNIDSSEKYLQQKNLDKINFSQSAHQISSNLSKRKSQKNENEQKEQQYAIYINGQK